MQMYLDDFENFPADYHDAQGYIHSNGMLVTDPLAGCSEVVYNPLTNKFAWGAYAWGHYFRSIYAYNAYGTGPLYDPRLGLGALPGPGVYTKGAAIVAPADMIEMGDVDMAIAFEKYGGLHSYEFGISSPMPFYWPARVHAGGANMVFCDSHVEAARQTNWLRRAETSMKRWNNDNAPHPEAW
jgi:prepilin-type processing-associated H-X9-DG protein